MRGVQFGGEEVAFHEGLYGVEGDAGEEGDVFEAGDEVGGCALDFGAGGDGGGEGGVEDGDVVVGLWSMSVSIRTSETPVEEEFLEICIWEGKHTSENIPPLPINSLISAARLSPEFSSSIFDSQSSLPVQISTCSAYGAIVPFSDFV